MHRVLYILLFVVVVFSYWNTDINNHTEADDAFEYAHMVEVDNHELLYHPHHLIYGPASKTVYKGMQAMGYDGRAYSLLVFISSLSAAGAVFLFYRFCRRCYGMRPVSSLLATGFLALSYGFWRYACEAEVVLPAGFLVLLSVYLALADPAEPHVYTHSTSEQPPTVSPRKKLPYSLIKTERPSKVLTIIRTSDAPVMRTIKTQPEPVAIISDSELIESLTKNGEAIAMTRKNDRCRVYMLAPSGRLQELTGSSLISD